jgi:hypothetical protein
VKTFIVESGGWKMEVEIEDESLYDESTIWTEAATRATEKAMSTLDEEFEMGILVMMYEKGETDIGKYRYIMSYPILVNSGRHDLAKKIKDILLEEGIDLDAKDDEIGL